MLTVQQGPVGFRSHQAGQELPLPALGKQIKEDYAAYDAGWLEGILDRLERDGLVALERDAAEIKARLPDG